MKFVIIVTHIKAGDSNENGKKDPLYRSFGYAFQGNFYCVRKERNMKIHCVAAVLVVIAGVILKISAIEWCICLVLLDWSWRWNMCEYGSGSGGGYGDRRISPVGESCERYRSRSGAHCGNYGGNCRVHYILPKIAQILQ